MSNCVIGQYDKALISLLVDVYYGAGQVLIYHFSPCVLLKL